MTDILKACELTKKYGDFKALSGISISLPEKGMIFIKGKSGSGKTTLLNILGGLDNLTDGSLIFNGKKSDSFNAKDWDNYRNCEIAFVFQDYNLIDNFTVYENINLALNIQDNTDANKSKDEIIDETLSFVGLNKDYKSRQVKNMSGGQKQRVAIARALAKKSKIILADEPTGNLDSENREIILSLLKKASKERLVVIVSHDLPSAYKYGDRVITIEDGSIVSDESLSGEQRENFYTIQVENRDHDKVFVFKEKTGDELLLDLKRVLFSDTETYFTISVNPLSGSNSEFPENTIPDTSSSAVPRNMPFQDRVKLSLQYLLRKKVRLISTVILFSMTLFLLIMVMNIFFYDRTEVISDYLTTHNIDRMYLYKNTSYSDSLEERHYCSVKTGVGFAKQISELSPDSKLVASKSTDMTLSNGPDHEIFVSDTGLLLTDNPDYLKLKLKSGRFPQNNNEITLTDYIAESEFNKDGTGFEISIDHTELTVVGIIETDYIEKNIARKALAHNLNKVEEYELKNKYKIAVVNPSFIELIKDKEDSLYVPRSNFCYSDMINNYVESDSGIVSVNSLSDKEPSYGKPIGSADEIWISEEYAQMLRIDIEEFEEKTVNYMDIYSSSFNDAFIDTLNMYDLCPEGLKVVGIIPEDAYADVVVEGTLYDRIIDEYYSKYWNDSYLVIRDSSENDSFVKAIDSNGFMIDEPIIEGVYTFQQNLEALKPVIVIIVTVLTLISLFMIGLFVSNSIKSNQKDIGVLKALGVTTNNVIRIFVTETVILSLLSFLIGTVDSFIFIYWINNCYIDQIPKFEIDYLYNNFPVCIFILVLSTILSLVSAVIPIRILATKKPIEIIREK